MNVSHRFVIIAAIFVTCLITANIIAGQGLDTAVFITIAYIGRFGLPFIGITILTHWLLKTGYEAVTTPFAYAVVNFLKKKGAIDTFDYETNFNPLLVSN